MSEPKDFVRGRSVSSSSTSTKPYNNKRSFDDSNNKSSRGRGGGAPHKMQRYSSQQPRTNKNYGAVKKEKNDDGKVKKEKKKSEQDDVDMPDDESDADDAQDDDNDIMGDDDNLLPDDYRLLKQKKSKMFSSGSTATSADGDNEDNEETEGKPGQKPTLKLSKKQEMDAKKMLPFIKTKLNRFAQRLMLKDFYTGMVVLGSFESISNMDLTFSLPFGAKGFVKFNEISDEFTKIQEAIMKDDKNYRSNFAKFDAISERIKAMFMVGQMIKIGVIGLTDHATSPGLHCTLRPEIVNVGSSTATFAEGMTIYGSVKSVEDKGYVISFGKDVSATGFLERSNTRYYWPVQGVSFNEQECRLSVGQPVEAVITSIDESTNVFKLNASHPLLTRSTVDNSNVITMDSIKAGMMVDTKVLRVYPNGLTVTFLDYFAGDIFMLHLEKPLADYKESMNLKARVLYVDQIEKRIGLSCQSHVLGLKPYPFGHVKVGDIIKAKDTVVERVDQLEMVISLQTSDQKKIKAYMHTQQGDDITNLKSRYQVGNTLANDCRVKHIDHVDGMLTVTTKKGELSKGLFSYFDITPAMILSGTIKIIRKDSIEVIVGPSIYGVVPLHNIGETILSDPNKKFKVGQTVKCRVLACQPQQRRLQLTLKNSLIQSTLPPFTQYDMIKRGDISHGYITNIRDNNIVFVSFYEKCFGIIQKRNLSRSPVSLIENSFRIGQVVTARVLGMNKVSLDLTLVLDDPVFDDLQIKEEPVEEENTVDVKEEKEDSEDDDEEEEDIEIKEESSDSEEAEVKEESSDSDDEVEVKQESSSEEEEEEKVVAKSPAGRGRGGARGGRGGRGKPLPSKSK
ncbi:hypothetical protein SAMD00019534_035190 [Acytostelium subglobosum LB1]|uniref:hypothetical protein n=1 Tax=Acytostelium subglobosum LB1 TaxID=1410327 RepID=UPI000644841A|nr:hypothetical protein SAMD00019534_035190 [Acytostelium subglobosum LB1]GAM20344.1 hypothetical protein SAMD00019534_035190 [Acytostelium subglobosum LB1]|eukprot:XP_012759865.1 hypothetical protein SAMD00019534_035190 [Acytostelium subglobosum LB1]